MKHPRLSLVLLAGALASPALSCADPCAEEARRTASDLRAARSPDVALYAGAELARAESEAAQADSICRRRRSRWLPFRVPPSARDLHARSRESAREAARKAGSRKRLVKQEALNGRFAAVQAVERVRASVERARRRLGEERTSDLTARLGRLREVIGEVDRLLETEDFLRAREGSIRVQEETVRLEADANNRLLDSAAR